MTEAQIKAKREKLYKEGIAKGLTSFASNQMADSTIKNLRKKGGKSDVTNIVGALSRRRKIEKARKEHKATTTPSEKRSRKFKDPDFSSPETRPTTYDKYDKSSTEYKKKKKK